MRSSLMGLVLAGGLGLAAGLALVGLVPIVPAAAQSPLDGPLVAPDAPPAPVPASHLKKTRAKKAHHAKAEPAPTSASAGDAAVPSREHVPTAAAAPAASAVDDPLSLGMKWNGNSDSAAQTRSQNLDGNAFGTGAEVGMKLHF